MSLAPKLGMIYLVSELLLTPTRRSRSRSGVSQDRSTLRTLWLVIMASIATGIYLASHWEFAALPNGWALDLVGLIFFVPGLAIRWWAIIVLGRFFTVDITIEKDHEVIEAGPYRVVRHPSYTGLLLAFVGFALALHNWTAFVVTVAPIFAAFLHRMNVEENASSRSCINLPALQIDSAVPGERHSVMECPFNHEREPQYYGDYLGIDQLLELQKPLSLREGKLIAHDEMLFIVVHQAYELWFKEIRHELEACAEVLSKPAADDDGPDMNVVVHRLKRTVEIWKLLNHQVDVLETMTPLDFLEFRELLHGASGFQSKQFRQIEAALGLRMENRFRPEYYKHTELGGFTEKDFDEISEFEKAPSLLQMVEGWLARAPFFDESFWNEWDESQKGASAEGRPAFWSRYRDLFAASLSERDDKVDLLRKFDEIFFKSGWGDFSPPALRSALFIMLYRDEPLFRLPFSLLNALIEIDEQLATFRYRHLQMVRRMIGTRVGTGGSSGEQYLQGAVNKNYIFKELAGVITFLIERRNLPALPPRLHKALRFSFAEV